MKTNSLRLVALALSVLVTLGAGAQKVNKVAAMQKVGTQTVIRSTDPRLPHTLVYFDHEVNLAEMPAEVRAFMGSYEEAVTRIENGSDPEEILPICAATGDVTVGPILGDIEFDQGTPYNDKCPVLNGGRAVTGCVATAMAEIMTFWQYPSVGKGTATYTGSRGATTYNFADHPFDWTKIKHTYKNGNYSTQEASAIAELMLSCGASVNMNYNAAGSGANSDNVLPALRDIFGYDPAIGHLHDATDEQIATIWVLRMKREFDANRPVYYAGSNQTSGHAFVIDGYRTEGDVTYFHVNWGWNGSMNGWFLISNLKPDDVNYSAYSNDCIYNIYPLGAGIDNVKNDDPARLDLTKPVYTILGTKIPAESMQRGQIYIQGGHKFVW